MTYSLESIVMTKLQTYIHNLCFKCHLDILNFVYFLFVEFLLLQFEESPFVNHNIVSEMLFMMKISNVPPNEMTVCSQRYSPFLSFLAIFSLASFTHTSIFFSRCCSLFSCVAIFSRSETTVLAVFARPAVPPPPPAGLEVDETAEGCCVSFLRPNQFMIHV